MYDLQDDQLYRITKSNVQQCAKGVAELARYGFGSKAQETSKRYDGDGIHAKNNARRNARDLLDGDADGDKNQQNVQFGMKQDKFDSAQYPTGNAVLVSRFPLWLSLFVWVFPITRFA